MVLQTVNIELSVTDTLATLLFPSYPKRMDAVQDKKQEYISQNKMWWSYAGLKINWFWCQLYLWDNCLNQCDKNNSFMLIQGCVKIPNSDIEVGLH